MTIVIVGAGPVGATLALGLHRRGYKLELYEARGDPRIENYRDKRSINLAISARGLAALDAIDPALASSVSSKWVPMYGRMIHTPSSEMQSVLYGTTGSESIHSIGRTELGCDLLNEVQKAGIPIHFNHKLVEVDISSGEPLIKFNGPTGRLEIETETLIGCDGTFSQVRTAIQRHTDASFHMDTVDTYYVEVDIKEAPHWSPNWLHIWPRGENMFIALPNADGSYTGTIFASRQLFATLDSEAKFHSWFSTQFPDAEQVIGSQGLSDAYSRTRGKLVTIQCSPYNLDSRALILGDAAHTIVPFYGQGCNCGLEDVHVLLDILDRGATSLSDVFAEYSKQRAPDVRAIGDLSLRNYQEMRDGVTHWSFRVRKIVDRYLWRLLRDRWLPLYTMVSFRSDISYSEAVANDAVQNSVFENFGRIALFGGFIAATALVKKWNRN